MTDMTETMKEIYSKHRGAKRGNDVGSHMVYQITIEDKHRGILQGYIGETALSLTGQIERLYEELSSGKNRRLHQQLRKYEGQWVVKVVQSGMTKADAKDLEFRLRPYDNRDGSDKYNWNTVAGG